MTYVFTASTALCATHVAAAQNGGNSPTATFSVCALNVDGLPTNIGGININPDGKGAAGAEAIGRYLGQKGYDVVALSEDFNYHSNLVSTLGDGYNVGTWRGSVDAGVLVSAAKTDGLGFMTKSPVAFSGESWTKWNKSYGKLTNGSDELISKGYRSYTVALADGTLVDFYIMHMDADVSAEDNAARASQWQQLSEAVLANRGNRPVIVMGDTNSRYTRDDIRSLFIAPVTAAGYYTCSDAWVELCQGGTYPTLGSAALVIPDGEKTNSEAYAKYEIVDKVLYLNPTAGGAARIAPRSVVFDASGYVDADGKPMGDHVPVVVTFDSWKATAADIAHTAAADWWRGEEVYDGKRAYMYNVGMKCFATSDSKPSAKDIADAGLWTATANDADYSFGIDGKAYIHMEYNGLGYIGSWNASISSKASDATTFALVNTDVRGGYRLSKYGYKQTRYLNIDNKTLGYSAAVNMGDANVWLLISDTQKDAYAEYVRLFTEACAYVGNTAIGAALAEELGQALESTAQSSYDSSASDNARLQSLVDRLKAAVPTGVSKPSGSQATATPVAIYTVDGRRVDTMQRGLNIVRMSDGTVRKVMR